MEERVINIDSQGHLIEPGDTIVWIGNPSTWKIQKIGRVTSDWDPNSRYITALANDSVLGRISRLRTYFITERQYDPELELFYKPDDPSMRAYIRRWERGRKVPWYNSARSEDWFTVRVWSRIVTLKDMF